MSLYADFEKEMLKIADIGYSMAIMGWDQEVNMPKNGASRRAQQLATLSGIYYDLSTSDQLGDLLQKLNEDNSLSFVQRRNIEDTTRSYMKGKKKSKELAIALSKATSEAFLQWAKARKEDDFTIYAPVLERIVALKREEAEMVGYIHHPYDALMDDYEPNATCKDLDVLFADVRQQLVHLTKEIAAKENVDDSFLKLHYPHKEQWAFGIDVLRDLGYDFDSGRQDLSTHPFTTNFGAKDVRVTTRVNENDFNEMIFSTIHEAGHGLYELGLDERQYGMPCGNSISLGVHESQSRIYENNLGRGIHFWKHYFPNIKEQFGALNDVNLTQFYHAINKVEPSFIRTNADELTYHFHILVRYELEKKLIDGRIEVNDIPDTWNGLYKQYLNVDVPSNATGCLQDIHWSHGSFGYFPTYSLGSFYAAQYYTQMKKDVPQLEQQIADGDFTSFLQWLRENVHQYGRQYSAQDLCQKITGETLNFKYFMDYAQNKYGAIYNLETAVV